MTSISELYEQLDDLLAIRGRAYEVFSGSAGENRFIGVSAALDAALDAATPSRGLVLEVDRRGVARAFDHTGRELPI